MLPQLILEGKQAATTAEMCRVLSEVAACVVQTGPRQGKFYFTDKRRKVYDEPPAGKARAAAGSATAARAKTRAEHDAQWRDVRRFPGDSEAVGNALWDLFGSKAPEPKEFAEMFSAQGIKAEMTSVGRGYGGSIYAEYKVKDQDGTKIGKMSREFKKDADGPYVYHALFQLNDEAQGGGRAGAMFGQALETYKKIGVKKVEVTAAITVGPYAWARFGFQPGASDMRDIKSGFTDFLQKPPIGLSAEAARSVVRDNGKDLHTLSSTVVRSEQLNPETGKKEFKSIKAGKDFLLYSQNGRPRSWHGTADLRDPEVVKKWEEQADKGVAARKKAIQEGRQNARDGSPTAVAAELRGMGDRKLASLVADAEYAGRPDEWNSAVNALKRVAKETPAKRDKIDSMLKRLAPFHQRVVSKHSYTREGRRKFTDAQRRAQDLARTRPAQPAAPSSGPSVPQGVTRIRPPSAPATGGGAGVSRADQAAAQARTAKRRAARRAAQAPAAAPAPAAPARAAAPPRPPSNETPAQAHARRAAKHGTTVAQEKRIDKIVQQKMQAERLSRRERRQQAQILGKPVPDFIPIRTYEKRQRAVERARLRR